MSARERVWVVVARSKDRTVVLGVYSSERLAKNHARALTHDPGGGETATVYGRGVEIAIESWPLNDALVVP